jgi:hypothetical protein
MFYLSRRMRWWKWRQRLAATLAATRSATRSAAIAATAATITR